MIYLGQNERQPVEEEEKQQQRDINMPLLQKKTNKQTNLFLSDEWQCTTVQRW